ncbi:MULTISPECIES: hypothetical protein [Rhodococcus]|uniref:hypothetical protein n=1 Tax=Rhodococcus TaxID=1827 RepID=UPI00143E42BD|nr:MULTISPECIES: hypothetical protein [Rhodococcus]QIX48951.1 hypothetical protein HFP48_04855 [Rhodococcus sp. DMU1]QRI75998.1 hypothetical protein JQ505_26575 [Rhodococcus aetherivorans]QSE59409.1 hypothetical protein JYA75_27675 [Rhodococcus sp. PSBB066]QSE69266.1 hypothetical protein JYA91_27780 [Rhodococcus sp. PSBB049]
MGTATQVATEVGGFAAPATLYRIDPPMAGADHLLIYTQPSIAGQAAQLVVLLATETGAVVGREVRPQPGSHVSGNPSDETALQLAGYMLEK